MEEPAPEPHQSSTRAKWSAATGQAILLVAIAWSLFCVVQAGWYMPAFNVRPLDSKWLAVTFITGALPTFAVLILAFLISWMIGAIRRRPDPWRSYRDGLVVASVFMLLINLGMWFVRPH